MLNNFVEGVDERMNELMKVETVIAIPVPNTELGSHDSGDEVRKEGGKGPRKVRAPGFRL